MEPVWFLTALVMALHKDIPAGAKAGPESAGTGS